jgi:hypothetical protein
MPLISQITQTDSMRWSERICEISVICAICVRFWKSRDPWPLYRDDRDSSTTRFALRSE